MCSRATQSEPLRSSPCARSVQLVQLIASLHRLLVRHAPRSVRGGRLVCFRRSWECTRPRVLQAPPRLQSSCSETTLHKPFTMQLHAVVGSKPSIDACWVGVGPEPAQRQIEKSQNQKKKRNKVQHTYMPNFRRPPWLTPDGKSEHNPLNVSVVQQRAQQRTAPQEQQLAATVFAGRWTHQSPPPTRALQTQGCGSSATLDPERDPTSAEHLANIRKCGTTRGMARTSTRQGKPSLPALCNEMK